MFVFTPDFDDIVLSLQSLSTSILGPVSRTGRIYAHSSTALLESCKHRPRFCAGPDLDRLSARILTFLSEP